MLRYHEIATDERRVLSLTSLTPEEFVELVPLFTTSFYEYLDEQTIEGYERVGRRYVPYRNSTLPTMEDNLLFILVYLKQAPTQEVQARLLYLIKKRGEARTTILRRGTAAERV